MPGYNVIEVPNGNKKIIFWEDTGNFTERDKYGNTVLYVEQAGGGMRVNLVDRKSEHARIVDEILDKLNN